MKKGAITLGVIISLFIALLVGVVFIDVLGDRRFAAETTESVTNESVTVASQSGQLANVELGVFELTFFGNSTYNTDNNCTVNVHANVSEAGVLTLHTNFSDGSYNATYGWYPDEYVQSEISQTLIGITVIFFAIAIAIISVMAIRKSEFF